MNVTREPSPCHVSRVTYLGAALIITDGIILLNEVAQSNDITQFGRVVNQGQSVLIVKWEISGDPRAQTSWTTYYSWDEETLPFGG